MDRVHRYRVPPRQTSVLTLRTQPDVACAVAIEGREESRITMFADPDGRAEFHVRTEHESGQPHRLLLTPDDGSPEHVVEILPSASPSELFADVPPSERTPGPAEPATRPGSWLERRLAAGSLVEPVVTPHPDARRIMPSAVPPESGVSDIWSGFELYGAPRSYDYVAGLWTVPAVTAGEATVRTSILSWVGIDGWNTSDLVQAGTGAESAAGGGVTISSYYAWTEFLPQQPTMRIVTNVDVRPGDTVDCLVLLSRDGELVPMPDIDGDNAAFSLWNHTTNQSTVVYVDRGATVVGGSEAEWIVERATYGDVVFDLADYGSTEISACVAHRVGTPIDEHVRFQDDTNRQITMVDGSTTLSIVSAVGPDRMRFDWQAFH